MGARRTEYQIVGRYMDGKEVTAYHLQSIETAYCECCWYLLSECFEILCYAKLLKTKTYYAFVLFANLLWKNIRCCGRYGETGNHQCI